MMEEMLQNCWDESATSFMGTVTVDQTINVVLSNRDEICEEKKHGI